MQPSSLVVFKIGPPPGPVVLDGCGVVDEGRVFFVAEIHAVGIEERGVVTWSNGYNITGSTYR
jgi:hypothetical protein